MESIGADLEEMKRQPLEREEVDAIAAIAELRDYAAGETVAEVGDPMDRFVYVLTGEIELVDPYTQQRMIESSLGPTQFAGELAFLNAGAHTVPLRAARPTRTLEAPRAAMLELMARRPRLADHVIGVFAARRRQLFEDHRSSIKLIGADRDARIQAVGRFLDRNRIPYESFDLDDPEGEGIHLCQLADHAPAVIFAEGMILDDPTPRAVARLLGLDLNVCERAEVDLLIVGGGPAGVAAAVYAGAEGLDALVVEDSAIGGQAGSSSRIENYMGFPTGISGADLAFRGQVQAMKFGTRFVMPRRVAAVARTEDERFCARLEEDDEEICAPAVLVATGVQYRRLPLPRLRALEGKGVYYAATEMEARFCAGQPVLVVGGGNSAGQAAMFLARHADCVKLIVREEALAETMSSYLRERLEADPAIEIHLASEVSALHGERRLEAVTVRHEGDERREPCGGLFIMIGAAPNTGWLSGLVDLDAEGFVITGEEAGAGSAYETSCPGVYAVGDVRAGSVKRVASAVGEGSVVVSAIWRHVARCHERRGEAPPGQRED
ncbi:FAD-dependent oxidoreductase [Sphingomicrobium astaxanthinifaciens]|uniref:FAD-dependent oxidoreductase n=1 Tax=Sphingomicrobium astaxanthinifaciens TaxID=1227949 RepID=UPI001FCA602C|nr:cyclic nucleotide-binding domain-containing thioredoxin-disulfide reductase [Sphingomicrobium astaxanthinifaciens]MCJ7421774.1 FAD-dependent oxidoreductase [Sphingomicrobium astaxanthinifaciens]